MVKFIASAGLDDSNIDYESCEVGVHTALVSPLALLRQRAQEAGFELALASGYRSFDRQLIIWNAKAEGRRPLLDDHGRVIDPRDLTPEQRLFAILRWSALPGASRHHWGTDFDVYDAFPCRCQSYKLQLTYEETMSGGIFNDFHRWLDSELESNGEFFRPYVSWKGGVAPEPWHLSFASLAEIYQNSLSKDRLRQLIVNTDIALKEPILTHFDEIFERFVWVDWQRYPSRNSAKTSGKC